MGKNASAEGGALARAVLFGAVCAALAGGCAPGQPVTPRASAATWADECSSLPGYLQFRARLDAVVVARDAQGLRALFHSDGAMRVNGVGGRAGAGDWGFDRPGAASVWTELRQILALGCVRAGENRVLLPAMAGLAQDGSLPSEYDVALVDLTVRARPDDAAPPVRTFRAGELVMAIIYENPPGWVEVLVNDRQGFVRSSLLRSPQGFQLILIDEGGRWSIREFGGGV